MPNFKHLELSDLNEFYQLYLYAFNRQDSEYRRKFFAARYKMARCYGLVDNEKLLSGMYALPFTARLHEHDYKVAGIGDVMTYPEAGGHGYATKMLQEALQELHDDDCALAYLAPFSSQFYRRLGFEDVFQKYSAKVFSRDIHQLNLDRFTGKVERGTIPENIAVLQKLYQPKNGMIYRTAEWWNYLALKNGWNTAIYYNAAGTPEGYLLYELEQKMHIQEWVCASSDAYFGLASFITGHSSMVEEIDFDFVDDNFAALFAEPAVVKQNVQPYMMARIVNVAQFLQNYDYLSDFDQVRIKVVDRVLPANDGVYLLSRKNGQNTVERSSDGDLDLAISVNELTALMLGAHDLEWAEFYRRLDILNVASAMNWGRSLRRERPEIRDYF